MDKYCGVLGSNRSGEHPPKAHRYLFTQGAPETPFFGIGRGLTSGQTLLILPHKHPMTLNDLPKLDLYRRIVKAKLFIDTNFAAPIDAGEIADEACYSKFHFIRRLK